jgi:asparagine synthase (glutamine-hydrolysing)
MCGIAGIVGPSASAEIAQSMAQRLLHRGPDGHGVWSEPGVALSHRRLAIQDLTDAGRMPMLFGSQVLTYNGELYNHERLRSALPGPWASTGDTEVLLRLLATEGSACLSRLVGMFAFASWDTQTKRLLLVRDRLGIKPLYYRLLPDGIAFASELKALMLLGTSDIDPSAVRDFLFHGYVPAPKTIYHGICKLPAGHTLTWHAGSVRVRMKPCSSSMLCCGK